MIFSFIALILFSIVRCSILNFLKKQFAKTLHDYELWEKAPVLRKTSISESRYREV